MDPPNLRDTQPSWTNYSNPSIPKGYPVRVDNRIRVESSNTSISKRKKRRNGTNDVVPNDSHIIPHLLGLDTSRANRVSRSFTQSGRDGPGLEDFSNYLSLMIFWSEF